MLQFFSQTAYQTNPPPKTDWTADILAMWSLVHGIAGLLANQSIKYEGDYLALVDTMLRNTFHQQP